MEFGQRVKKVRKEKTMTLEELSKRSDVSKSMLSQIEREEKKPTIQVASQIAAGLGVTVSQLLGEHKNQEAAVIRKSQRPFQRNPVSGFERHLLSPSLSGNGIEFILHVIPPFKESGPLLSQKQGVEEYIYVAQGKLKIELGKGQDVHVLNEGDSIFFEADTEHRFVNLSDYDCHFYLIIDSYKV